MTLDRARLDGRSPVADVLDHLDTIGSASEAGDRLVALLSERAAIYEGRGTGEAERIRAAILGRIATLGAPPAAMPFVLEELETGTRAAPVAAAARAVGAIGGRLGDAVPERLLALMLLAVRRMSNADEFVRIDDQTRHDVAPTTALTELFRAIASLGIAARSALPALREMAERRPAQFAPAIVCEIEAAISTIERGAPATCCGKAPSPRQQAPILARIDDIDDIEIEDQDGWTGRFADLFAGRPAFVTFFYTRCMNPGKCSLTITKLASLRQELSRLGWGSKLTLAAISYDPAFDRADRLAEYGRARGLAFDPRCRLVRTTGPIDPLRDYFELGVGYGPATVNQHRLECAVLDSNGRFVERVLRRQWSVDEAVAALRPLVC